MAVGCLSPGSLISLHFAYHCRLPNVIDVVVVVVVDDGIVYFPALDVCDDRRFLLIIIWHLWCDACASLSQASHRDIVSPSYREVRGLRVAVRPLSLTSRPDDVGSAEDAPALASVVLPIDMNDAVLAGPLVAQHAFPELGLTVRVEVLLRRSAAAR